MILDIEYYNNKLIYSYFDEKGEVQLAHYPINQPYYWKSTTNDDPIKHSRFMSWDNKPVVKKRSNHPDKFFTYEFQWMLPEGERQKIFALNYPKRSVIDIETDWNGEREDPNYTIPITTLAVVMNDQAMVLGVKDLSQDDISDIHNYINRDVEHLGASYNFRYIRCKNECDLLCKFWYDLAPNLGLVTGWNVLNFDIAYLIHRAIKNSVDYLKVSPTRKLLYDDSRPTHFPVMDYATIFNKYDTSIKVKESNKLDFVSEKVLGVKKVEYKGSLYELYRNDYKRYVYYNIIDTVLVQEIDRKADTLNLASTVSYLNYVELNKCLTPVPCTEAQLSFEFWKLGKVITKGKKAKKTNKYQGAFVKKPIPGYRRGIKVGDFSSLYPSAMRSCNISPETYVGFFEGSELEKYKKDENFIASVSGAVYRKKRGVLNKVLTEKYNLRMSKKDDIKTLWGIKDELLKYKQIA